MSWGQRPPPPNGAPPRYASIVQRVYPHSMRVPLIVIASIGLLWAAVMSASAFRENDDFDNAGSNRTFDIILGILYASVVVLEIYVLVVAVLQRAALAKFLRILVPVGVVVAIAAQTIALVVHYTTKDNFIDSCKTYIMEHTEEFAINGNAGAVTPTIAQEACLDYWKRGSWHAIAWLIGVLILSLFFGMITLSFYRQVINPNFGTQPLNQSFPMYAQNPPPPPGFGQPQAQDQTWMVPPYPGPPAVSKGPYEKGDYQPDAEWAQVNAVEYDRPSGPPPPRGGFGGGSGGYREESSGDPAEDAWQRAQREGVTAHYTGHAPAPRATNQEESGYRVGNTEEDEAWERAKNEGVTAHFTGAGSSRADGRAGGVV